MRARRPAMRWRNLHAPAAPVRLCRHDRARYKAGMSAPRPAPPARRRREAEGGFTLLEVLVVIAILGLLISLVAPAALRQLGSAKTKIAAQNVSLISNNLELYKLDVGSYPTSEQGLLALAQQPSGVTSWNGPYGKAAGLPMDPWNHPYFYRAPSSRRGHDFDLCSGGPNSVSGEPGTPGTICNP